MTSPSDPANSVSGGALHAALLDRWPLPLQGAGDKFSRGTFVVVGGADSTPGAVLLAAEAALRMGAGRAQIVTSRKVATAVAVALPEAAVLGVDSDTRGTLRPARDARVLEWLAGAQAVLVGPGVADGPGVAGLVAWVLEHAAAEATLVVDAAAIAALADTSGLATRAGHLLLTPNDVELAAAVDAEDGGDAARTLAHRLGATVTSFGTVTAHDGRRWVTNAERPGLGTSGSGDVLAGFAVGAAARGASPAQAACWATYAHAAAADALAREVGPIGYLARDLMGQVPRCLPRADGGARATGRKRQRPEPLTGSGRSMS